jgi:hypothetical protein
MSLAIDLSPFFTAMNDYIPTFLSVFGIVGAIAGAMALSRTIVSAVVGAFSGRAL